MQQIRGRDRKGVDNPGAVVKRDVKRWYAVLHDALSEVKLSPLEALVLICYVARFEGEPTHVAVMTAHEGIGDTRLGLSQEFRATGDSLSAKYMCWSTAAKYAAWDAAERYQVLSLRQADDPPTFGMALHTVGLHTYDISPDELSVIERMKAAPADFLPGVYLRALEMDR
jgi:hypothetical protein